MNTYLFLKLLSGKLYECVGEDLSNITTKNDCLTRGYEWRNSFENYDNVLQALFTLFIIATKDGWTEYMYKGIDAVGVDMQPAKNHNEYMAVFYIFYLLVVGFFVVNMFVGVIVDNFHKCRREQQAEENRIKAEKKALSRAKFLRGNFQHSLRMQRTFRVWDPPPKKKKNLKYQIVGNWILRHSSWNISDQVFYVLKDKMDFLYGTRPT